LPPMWIRFGWTIADLRVRVGVVAFGFVVACS
jgi:hypothetical protein